MLTALLLSACSSSKEHSPSPRGASDAEALDATSSSLTDGRAAEDAPAGDATTSDSNGGEVFSDSATWSVDVPNDLESDVENDATKVEPADGEPADDSGGSGISGDSGVADEESSSDASLDDTATTGATGATETSDSLDASSDAVADVGAAAEGALVIPELVNGDYVFVSGLVSLAVDPQHGARVVSFALAGNNVLSGTDANAANYGSTFWTSPQSDWNWPPPREIDTQPYEASVDGGTLLLLGSPDPALGVRIAKLFSLDRASAALSVTYVIENVGTLARSVAPWEVSRVHPSGLLFFPTGTAAHDADGGPPLPIRQASGTTWLDFDAATITANTKYFAEGSRGWLAQENGGLVFVKKFPEVSPDAQAPGEAEIELFVSGDHSYVELENQGVYASVSPGKSVQWTVRWYLVAIPPGTDASLGSTALVSFVDGLK